MALHWVENCLRWAVKPLAVSFAVSAILLGAGSPPQRNAPASDFEKALTRGRALRDHDHDCAAALREFQVAERAAAKASNADQQALAWLSTANCADTLHRVTDTFAAATTGYHYARIAGNDTWLGIASTDLVSSYRAFGELGLAEKYGLEAVQFLKNSPRKEYLPTVFGELFYIREQQGRLEEGLAFSDQAIASARSSKYLRLLVIALDIRAFILLHHRDRLTEAQAALDQERAAIAGTHNTDFPAVLEARQAELEAARGNYKKALRLSDHAFAIRTKNFPADVSQHYYTHVRGQIYLGLKDKPRALAAFRRAVEQTNEFRETALLGDSLSTQATAYLDDFYRDFALLAADLALSQHNPALAREGLEALAQNRAASLREQLTLALVKQARLGGHYFDLLSRIQELQARVTLGHGSAQDAARLNDARMELIEVENGAVAGPTISRRAAHPALRDVQGKLKDSELLLSFCLGPAKSYLWAITAGSLKLYELPPGGEITRQAKEFTETLRNRQDARAAGMALSKTLFGRLSARESAKRDWLITQDGGMVGLAPYPGLPDSSSAHRGMSLIANHTMRLLPSEFLLLNKDEAPSQHRFVGVADPIYNLADSRRAGAVKLITISNGPAANTLGRLVGSQREVESANQIIGSPDAQILAGRDATGLQLRSALQKAPPELVHLAVHVVSPAGKPQEAALALSLTKDNVPELVTREMVATYRVPGSLVVLSGCASGQGRALPSAGLIGLSRAWLAAGAAAVVVSSWPIPDDSGQFFSSFYTHLRSVPPGGTAQRAALALSQAQMDMQHSAGYRGSPSFWAAYSLVSKE